MSFVRRVKYLANNSADAAGKIKDDMVSMGWTLHDDQSGASKYYVLYSDGEDSDLPKVYVKLDWNSANTLKSTLYLYWNNSTHVGTVSFYSSQHDVVFDDDDTFYLWVYGDKNFITIITNVTAYDGQMFGAMTPFVNHTGTLQSGVSSGSNVVLTLAAGEADKFKANYYYQIVGVADEGRDRVQVTNVNKSNNQITISNLPRNYGANSIIGLVPWPWIIGCFANASMYPYNLYYNGAGTTNESNHSCNLEYLIDTNYTNPDERVNEHILIPYYFKEYNSMSVAMGYIDNYIMKITIGADEDIATSGELDEGTSSGSNTSTTLNDTTKSWATNEWENKCLAIIDGTGSGQIRKISSNTATALTVDVAWTVTPDATSDYIICSHGWRIFYFSSSSYRKAVMEV